MFLKCAFVEQTVHMQEVRKRNLVGEMVAE